ncbi:hypothetical protein CCP4SC76_5550010 [Gammaproteobacteria bacterium]
MSIVLITIDIQHRSFEHLTNKRLCERLFARQQFFVEVTLRILGGLFGIQRGELKESPCLSPAFGEPMLLDKKFDRENWGRNVGIFFSHDYDYQKQFRLITPDIAFPIQPGLCCPLGAQ